MSNPILTNEQKLNQIYSVVMANESRRKSLMWFRFFKWVIIIAIAYFVVTQPDKIIWPLTERIKPIIMSTASGMISDQKAEMIKSLKDILPPDVEIQ